MNGQIAPVGHAITFPDPPGAATRWTIRVYTHTHWDREWYQPFERFRMQLVSAIDSILDTLEADPSFTTYVLDGQTIVLDDYLYLHPERAPQLERLIAAGRIEVGPWYILPDEFLVSGESIVRNLLLGRRGAARFGKVLPIGYLPDPFGHVAQLPQILNGFGIGSVIFSRGMGDEFRRLGSEFVWEGLDGETEVVAIVQTGHENNGYCNAEAMSILHDPADPALPRLADELGQHLAVSANTSVLLFAAGCDHETVNPQLPEIIRGLNAQLGNADMVLGGLNDVVADIERQAAELAAAGTPLERYSGELRGSLHAPILASIFSARIPLKQDNVLLQTWLERYVEPLTSLAHAAGAWTTRQSFIDHAWQLALKNQPHDSIGGCSVDIVHDEMPTRTMRALEVCQGVVEELQLALGCEAEVTVFNPQAYDCGGIAQRADESYCWLPELPALQLSTLPAPVAGAARVLDAQTIESDVLRVGAGADGRVQVTLRRPDGEHLVLDDALQLIDEADAGDEYDFGQLAGDAPLVARLAGAEARLSEGGVAELELHHVLELPESLVAARDGRSDDTVGHQFRTVLRIAGDQPWVECVTTWENWSLDHRLRVRCALGAPVTSSVADGHFGVVERPAVPAKPQSPWKQDPVAGQHCEHFTSIADADAACGLALFGRGLQEYEVTAASDGTARLELTLLRAVGWLSRDDIVGRPGHAGPELETPGAQGLGLHEVEYAIAPFAGDWQAARLPALARRYAAPPFVLEPINPEYGNHSGQHGRARDMREMLHGRTPGIDGFNNHGVWLEGIELSAIKLAADGSGDLIVRGYNPYRNPATATLHRDAATGAGSATVSVVRLDETCPREPAIEPEGNAWSATVPGGGICTFRISSKGPAPA